MKFEQQTSDYEKKRISERVCVIICNWNKREFLLKCLDSVYRSSYGDFDVLVVDNASEDGSVEAVRSSFPRANVLENQQNLGGAGGFNAGLRYAIEAGEYAAAWLLDNDVTVDPRCLEELVLELGKCGRNAVVGSLILRMDSPGTLQELGAFIDKTTFNRVANKRDFPLHDILPEPIVVNYVPACSLLVDIEKLEQVGLMDEGYFLYFDDVEWCTRFIKAGYRVLATPLARVWHNEGGRNKTVNLPVYYTWRNYLHFFLHYLTDAVEINAFIEKYIIDTLAALYVTRLLGKMNAHQTILWAIGDAVRGIRGKAAENRALSLDEEPFGRFFYKDFKRLKIIGEVFDFYTQFEKFLERIPLDIPVEYYTPKYQQELPQDIRERVVQRPMEELGSDLDPSGEVLVFCKHILTAPNPYEQEFPTLLETNDEQVFYLDRYSNFYQGYGTMREEREKYNQELQHALAVYAPMLRDMFGKGK
jgi:GT2 family glycosyltransferase